MPDTDEQFWQDARTLKLRADADTPEPSLTMQEALAELRQLDDLKLAKANLIERLLDTKTSALFADRAQETINLVNDAFHDGGFADFDALEEQIRQAQGGGIK